MARTRARRYGLADAPPTRRPGPAPAAAASTRAAAQRKRRMQSAAAENLGEFLASLVALRIFPITKSSEASDTTRLAMLVRAGRHAGMPAAPLAALAMLDWAARCPALTSDLIAAVGDGPHAAMSITGAVALFRQHWCAETRATYWRAQSRLCLQHFLRDATAELLEPLASAMASAGRSRCARLMSLASSLPHLGPYLGFALLRSLSAAMGKTLRDATGAAMSMSAHTSKLAAAVPLRVAASHMRAATGRQHDDAFMAWVYCEGVKVLRHENVLRGPGEYDDGGEAMREDLVSEAMSRLLARMRDMEQDSDLSDAAETAAVAALVPESEPAAHSATDVLRRWRRLVAPRRR